MLNRKVLAVVAVLSASILGAPCSGQVVDVCPELHHKRLKGELPFLWPQSTTEPLGGGVRSEAVLTLLQDLFPEDSLKTVFAMESYRLANLDGGKPYLVAVTDGTGRAFFNTIEVIRCDGRECTMTSIGSDGENDLTDQVVDLDEEGFFAIITRERAGAYEGGGTRPIYTYAIRKLLDGELVDVSGQYPGYFREHILPKMAADRREVQRMLRFESSGAAGDRDEMERRRIWAAKARAELQFVQDEYHRRVLGEKTAGLDNALRWARSEDVEIRRFAVRALEPIASAVAAEELERLTHSEDSRLARDARNALDNRRDAHLPGPAKTTR